MPVRPCADGLRCVQTCMRVVLNQTKNGLFAFTAPSMNLFAAS